MAVAPVERGAPVKLTPAEKVAHFLSFSGDCHEPLQGLRKFSHREWRHVLRWLDDSGLALYFLQKLKNAGAIDAVPKTVLSELERDFNSNQLRTKELARRFAALNRGFDEAGVAYTVVKGFSLVPDFCPSAVLRYQADLDYLVEGDSLPAARQIMVDAGYLPQQSTSSKECIFVTPALQSSCSSDMYSVESPHAVELHTDMWDERLHGVPLPADLFSVKRAVTRHWNGLTFPALSDEDAVLLQVAHACHHVFTLWIRMSCLFEIAHFLKQRASDAEFWGRVERRVGGRVVLREFVVIVSELAARLFAAPLPPLVRDWGVSLRPGARIWLEHYARRWAFCELPVHEFRLFPRSKFALFLRQQYEGSSGMGETRRENDARPRSRLARMAVSIRNEPSIVLNRAWWRRQLLIRRGVFHAFAGARYVCELPRWLWLNRTRVRPASS
jgi:hypothetical protein